MDTVVNKIYSASTPEELDSLRKYLDGHMQVLKNNVGQINNSLGSLDPNKHSLGMCYLLAVKSQHCDQPFLTYCEQLLSQLDPSQIRERCCDKLATVVHKYTELLRAHKQPQRAIPNLLKLITALRVSPDHFTPAHPDFVLLCLVAKNYKAAVRVIGDTIFDISPRKMGVTPRDVLLYYYYGGMVWIGLKQWTKAHEFFQTCITIPCTTLSLIMVEAYKKLTIVSLITKGKTEASLPKQCSNVVIRHLKKYAPEYNEFANAYNKREYAKLQEIVDKHGDLFEQDRNMGIVQQALVKYVEQAIQRLTSTYLTLSLGDIASNVGLQNASEAEFILVRMIAGGELSACINQKDGMVSFTDAVGQQNLLVAVEQEIDAAQRVVRRLEAMDEDIQTSREYVMKQLLRDPNHREEIESEARSHKGKAQRFIEGLVK